MNTTYIFWWAVVGLIYVVASLKAEYDAQNHRNFRNNFTKHAYIISVSLFLGTFMALTIGSMFAYVTSDVVEIISNLI